MKRRSLQLKTQLMQFRKEGLKKFKFRLAGKPEFFHNTRSLHFKIVVKTMITINQTHTIPSDENFLLSAFWDIFL